MNMPLDTAPEQPADDERVTADAAQATVPSTPILPAQSSEDTDVGWGEYRERDNDDRLLRDRPPHWDNA
jgi:hypothetical protein